MIFNSDSFEINYLLEGNNDRPWLIFSNSIATDLTLWDDQVKSLQDQFHILRYDQRGHGKSGAPEGSYTIELVASDLLNLMDGLGIETASLVGISMGAMTVLTLAKNHPDRIDKLVVCDCGPAASEASAQQWQDRIKKVLEGGMSSILDETLARWFTEKSLVNKTKAVQRVTAMVEHTSTQGFIGCANALSTFDLRDGLETLNIPTLFMAGVHDGVVGGTRKLHETVANSSLKLIEDAGHLCNIEMPQQFTEELMQFLLENK